MNSIRSNKPAASINCLFNVRLLIQSAIVIFGFMVVKQILLRDIFSLFSSGPIILPELLPSAFNRPTATGTSPYEEWSMFAAAMRHPFFATVFVTITVFSFLFFRQLSWNRYGRISRIFITTAAAIMAWWCAMYSYNLYVDQPHVLDRILVIAFAVAVFFHPAFIAPSFILTLLSMSQFNYPLGEYVLTDKQLPLFSIILFLGFHLAMIGKLILNRMACWMRKRRRCSSGNGRRKSRLALHYLRWMLVGLNAKVFLFLLLCLFGASYLQPALEKILISPSGTEWFLSNELDRLVAFAILRDYYFFMTEGGGETAMAMSQALGRLLIIATLVIEVSAILILSNRKLACALLVSFACLNLGIFWLSGIFFWKWVILDLVLAVLVLAPEARPVFNRKSLFLSMLIMLTAIFHFRPIALAWFDTALVDNYRFTLTTEDGSQFEVSETALVPHDFFFIMESYDYINPEKILPGTGQTSNYRIADEINNSDAASMPALLNANGQTLLDEIKAYEFDAFLTRYFENWNQRMDKRMLPFDIFSAPPHIWSGKSENAFQWDQRVAQVDIYYETAFFDGHKIERLESKLIRRIAIPVEAR